MQNFIRLAHISWAAETNSDRIKELNDQILSKALQFNEKKASRGVYVLETVIIFNV